MSPRKIQPCVFSNRILVFKVIVIGVCEISTLVMNIIWGYDDSLTPYPPTHCGCKSKGHPFCFFLLWKLKFNMEMVQPSPVHPIWNFFPINILEYLNYGILLFLLCAVVSVLLLTQILNNLATQRALSLNPISSSTRKHPVSLLSAFVTVIEKSYVSNCLF